MNINKVCNGRALLIAVWIAMLALLMAEGAGAATITVNASGGADYTRIQDAVNAASNGDTITVAAGTYNENVVVNKSVSLIGAGAEVTIVNAYNPGEHVFNVTVNSVNISGFTARGAYGGWPYYAGIYLSGVNYTNISNNKASSNFFGIYLYSSNHNTLTNNTANSNANFGIYLDGSSSNTLIKSTANSNYFGIWLHYSSSNTLTNNTANSNNQGICLEYYSNSNILINNTANSNGNYGIKIGYYSSNNIVANNTVNSNNIGIEFGQNANDNKIFNNFFSNPNRNFFFTALVNTWNTTKQSNINIINGPYLGGNFWANPSGTGFSQTCTDADRDGICDSTYVLDANNIDYLPLSMNFTFYYNYNLTGKVINTASGLGISGAVVKFIDYPQYNATTNSTGDYSMSVPAGTYNVSASAAGYTTNTTTIIVSADSTKTFTLQHQCIHIDSAEWLNETTIRFYYSNNSHPGDPIGLIFTESDGTFHAGAGGFTAVSQESGYGDFVAHDLNDLYWGADSGYTRYYALTNADGQSNIIRLPAHVASQHNQPVTTATFSSNPDSQGEYPNPVTVTLSGTAASGYLISQTYYTLDGGAQQTYTAPFTVSGSGDHTITYWSVDNAGLEETPHNTMAFTLQHQGIHIDSAEWLNETTIRFHYSQNTYAPDPIGLIFTESDGTFHAGAGGFTTVSQESGYGDFVAHDLNDLYWGADSGYTRYYALVGGSFADRSNIIRLPAYAVGSDRVWIQVPNMTNSHVWGSGIIPLENGKVLVVTGADKIGLTPKSELFDPELRTWTTTGNVNQVRILSGNAIVRLNDGKTMIAGNEGPGVSDLSSVELYDPSTGTWSYTGSLQTARRNPAVIKLQNGKVLITGGANGPPDGNRFLASTEIYDPATGQWTYSGNLNVARELANRIVLMHDGRVMIAGGEGPWWIMGNTAEIYDPNTGQWTLTPPMLYGWGGASMTVLNDGRVLVSGGYNNVGTQQRAMLYDPGTNTWTETGSMHIARAGHNAVLLSDGKVLVVGGGTTSSEYYDPATGQWTTAAETRQASHNGIAVLQNGDILAVGGDPDGLTAELFTESLSNSGKAFNISGYKINDTNGNGQWDAGEVVIPGWNITLKNATTGAVIASNFTDANGFYQFQNLVNGTYNVSEEMRSGFTNVTPISIISTIDGADVPNQNFTNMPVQVVMQASITSPSQQTFAFGSLINLNSQVTGGTSPYTYSWESSRDGIISTASSFSISNLSIGTHTITLTVTDADSIKATNTKAITVTGIDLSLKSSDIGFSKAWPMKDEEITLNASIANDGSESATNVNVRFYDNDLLIGETLIPSISHHSSSLARINYVPDISGYRLIKVVIDEANSILEGDETNNIAIRPIAVGNGNFYGSIELSASIQTPKYTGEYARVSGSAIYNTTFGSGESVAGALVTITIDGTGYTTYTTSSGTFSTDIIVPYSSGQYPVLVRISDNTFVKEESLTLTVNNWPAQLPDLIITENDITFPQVQYVANVSGTVNARIVNIGSADATGVTISFYDDGVLFETSTIPAIPKFGGSVSTSAPITPSYRGMHSITVKVDADNSIPETNELNNQASGSLYVYPDLPDFTPTDIYYSDSTPYDGQQVTVSARIANIGGKDSATSVSFYLDDILKNTVSISIQGRNGYAVASSSMTFTNVGTHQIRVVVDEAGTVQESDEGNNQLTSSIYVHAPQPDLKADEIFLNISSPVSGDSVLVTGIFRNDGETSADNVIANLYVSGLLVNTITIPTLAVGSSQTITGVWTPTSHGYFDILLSVDPQKTIAESNEYNNNLTKTFYVYPALPDPYPLTLSTPSIAEIGDPVTINAVIKNKGGISTGLMQVKLYDNDSEIFSTSITVPGKDGTASVSTTYSFASSGTHTIKVKVDPDNAIPEFDESNNELLSTTYILPPLPDLIVESISFDNPSPIHDEVIHITAAVRNIGKLAASNVKVALYNDDIRIGETTVSEIAVLETNSTAISWTAIGGSHTIKAVVDPYYEITETNETNNSRTKSIGVRAPDIQIRSQDIYYSNNNPDIDENIVIYANVSNVGTYLADNIVVNFYVDDIFINTTSILSISNNSFVMVTSNWIAEGEGSHVVRVETIYGGFELSGMNNAATRGLVVGQDAIPPASVTDLHNISYSSTYINWTWTDPADIDFDHVEIYFDGIQKPNVLAGVRYYNATGLNSGTTHEISTRTVDNSGNVNATWKNQTATTAPISDTPPASVTGLTNITFAQTYINWTWTDPADPDFSKVMIYINGTFKTNVTNGTQYFNATGLALNKSYEISTHTVDTSGNINQTWKNHTAKTAPGRVHNINKRIDYLTIQSAIDGASKGDEIHVDSGIYFENVNVNRQVILIGVNTSNGKPVVDARRNGNAITLSANGITLNGFTVINASNPYAGIRVNSNNNILIGNNASNNNNGIHLENSINNNITGNIARNNDVSGIRLRLSNSNTILNNIIGSNHNNGIYIISSNNNTVARNTVSFNYYGIALTTSSINTISNNTISFNDFISLLLQSSIDNTIYNNLFNNNMGPSTLGYSSNRLNTTKTDGTNIIGGPYLGGNFWANPSGTGFSQTCTDANNDWICDTSYSVASGNIDYHPLVQPGYINGTVMNNSIGIAGAVVTTNTTVTATANELGVYSLLLAPGAYNLTVTKEPEFYSNISVIVTAISGMTLAQDIELLRKPTSTIGGTVRSV